MKNSSDLPQSSGGFRLGVASTSFAGAAIGGKVTAPSENMRAPVRDTLQFLEQCHAYGAAGIQARINGDPVRIRKRSEELGMWVEAMISIRSGDPDYVEQEIVKAKAAGCTIGRDGMLAGRRYESFQSVEEWHDWVRGARRALETSIPIFEKHRFTLALENHKDWTLDEYLQLFRNCQSEYFGACLDFGNNVSLLDDPMTVLESVAPFTKATHFKDIALAPYEDGFLLSEVVLGKGLLDLPAITALLLRHNSRLRFSLEVITRDPLEVPCLTDHYWEMFPNRGGVYLARTLRLLNQHAPFTSLPRVSHLSSEERSKVEQDNVIACLRYADQMQLPS